MSASHLSPPDTKAGKLQRACRELLREHERAGTIPTNVTFLFYELEQRGKVPKHYLDADGKKRARTPRQDVSDATMRLRELGLVPWWWIVDESRNVEIWRFARTALRHRRRQTLPHRLLGRRARTADPVREPRHQGRPWPYHERVSHADRGHRRHVWGLSGQRHRSATRRQRPPGALHRRP